MKHIERDWLRTVPWETVLSLNKDFCEAQKTIHETREGKIQQAQQKWERTASRRLPLLEALDLCKQCCELGPFLFNNGNTFAAAARKIMEDWLATLPAIEAQIARGTAGHYVVGQVTRKELSQVLAQFEARWPIRPAEAPMPAAALPPLPQAQLRAS